MLWPFTLGSTDIESVKIVRPSQEFKDGGVEKSFSLKSSAKVTNPLLTEHVEFKDGGVEKSSAKVTNPLLTEHVEFRDGGVEKSLTCRSCNSKSNIDKDTLKSDNIINKPTIYNVKKKKLRRQLLKLLGFLILLIIWFIAYKLGYVIEIPNCLLNLLEGNNPAEC